MTLLEARSKLRWAVTLAKGRIARNVTVCCGEWKRPGQSYYCAGCIGDGEVLAQLEAVLAETETVGPEQLPLFEAPEPPALDDSAGGGVASGG